MNYDSFNTNSYRTKVRLEDIDRFVYDLQNDTDDIVRDFHKNKEVMKTYFSDLAGLYKGYEESILLLVYLVLCMKTKLMKLDKKIGEYIISMSKSHTQMGGTVDEDMVMILEKHLPLAFSCIYNSYVMYKINYIQRLFNREDVAYLDQVISAPILSNSRAIVHYVQPKERNCLTYFNSYCDFYTTVMSFIKDFVSKKDDQLRKDDMSELYRYYVYRRIIEFDITDKIYREKNDTIRENIDGYDSGYAIISMLYGSIPEDTVELYDCLRKKASNDPNILVNIQERFVKKIKFDDRELIYNSKTLDRITKQITGLLEMKKGGALFFSKDEPIRDIDKQILYGINIILYSALRKADGIHDFMKGDSEKESADRVVEGFLKENKKRNFLNALRFFYNDNDLYIVGKKGIILRGDKSSTVREIIEFLNGTKIFDKKEFVYSEDDKNIITKEGNINLYKLNEILNERQKYGSNFEDEMISILNKYLFCISKLNVPWLTANILKNYRPGNKLLEKISEKIPEHMSNKAFYVNKEQLFEMENALKSFDETILRRCFSEQNLNDNLLFVIYHESLYSEESVTNAAKKAERQSIIKTVTDFFGTENVLLSIDSGTGSKNFLKIFTLEEKSDTFIYSDKIAAEKWDPAGGFKSLKDLNIPNSQIPYNLENIDLLNVKNNIPICEKDYKINIEEKNNHILVHTGVDIPLLGQTQSTIDLNDDDTRKRFKPSVKEISELILKSKKDSDICKFFYLKNSGDWGEATSANYYKSFLLTDDKLCSFYTFLTNTSTIFTIKHKGMCITMLFKGDIQKPWKYILPLIQTHLQKEHFYVLFNKITIVLGLTNKVIEQSGKKKVEEREIIHIITYNKHSEYTSNYDIEKIQIDDLQSIRIISITYTDDEGDELTPLDTDIRSTTKSIYNDISTTIFKELDLYIENKIQNSRIKFLGICQKDVKLQNIYNEKIYSDYFDINWYNELYRIDSLTDEQVAHITTYVKNTVKIYVEENIINVYVSSIEKPEIYRYALNNIINNKKSAGSIDFKYIVYRDGLLKWLIEFEQPDEFQEIDFIKKKDDKAFSILKQKIQEIINNIEDKSDQLNLLLEKATNIEEVIQFLDQNESIIIESAKEKLIQNYYDNIEKNKFDLFKIGVLSEQEHYITYSDKLLEYKMNHYNYKYKVLDELKNDSEKLFISSILTNGLWDLFEMNPYIYALLNLYLEKNLRIIPLDPSSATNIESSNHLYHSIIKTIDDIILTMRGNKNNYFGNKKKDDEIEGILDNHIKEKELRNTYPPLERKLLALRSNIEIIVRGYDNRKGTKIRVPLSGVSSVQIVTNINEFINYFDQHAFDYYVKLFYYLYSLISHDDKRIICFNSLQNVATEFRANIKPYLSINPYNITPGTFLKDYFDKVKKIIIPDDKELKTITIDDIIQDADNPLVRYFTDIILTGNKSVPEAMIQQYVDELKLKKEDEYYQNLVDILDMISKTINVNEDYLDFKTNKKVNALWFQQLIDTVVGDYKQVSQIIKQTDTNQYILFTQNLLENIRDLVAGKEHLQYIHIFLTKVLEVPEPKEKGLDATGTVPLELDRYVEIYNIIVPEEEIPVIEEQGDEYELEVEVSLEKPVEVSAEATEAVAATASSSAVAEAVNASSSELAKRVSIQSILNDSAKDSKPKCIAIKEYREAEGCPIGDHEFPTYECTNDKGSKGSNKLDVDNIKNLLRCIGVEIPPKFIKKDLCDLLKQNRDCFQEGILFDGEVKLSSGGAKDVSKNGCILS